MNKPKGAFVPLSSVRGKARTPAEILAEIRSIYFRTRRESIQDDLDHAVALLKTLPTEDDRQKATVYMEGLAQMRKDWAQKRGGAKASGNRPKAKRS